MSVPCPHLYVIDSSFTKKKLDETESRCDWCNVKSPCQWLCLYSNCLKVGCGTTLEDHSSEHNTNYPAHCVTINLGTKDAWCYMCEMEVTPWVMAKIGEYPEHLGGPINTSGITVARPVTPWDTDEEEEDMDVQDKEYDEECAINENFKPKGLVGLRNLGLTCYMNAALQALSNSPPLTQFMIDFPLVPKTDRKQPGLSILFQKLMNDMWSPNCPSYITPTSLYHGFKQLYPSFRMYSQQDSQEFLRYFMDQIHEELREPTSAPVDRNDTEEETQEQEDDDLEDNDNDNNAHREDDSDFSMDFSSMVESEEEEIESTPSEEDYETCDSAVSVSSMLSNNKRKRSQSRKRQQQHQQQQDVATWAKARISVSEHESSEFSDAVSDASLLKSGSSSNGLLKSPNLSSATSGLGSSKPSMSSLSSSLRHGSQACIPTTTNTATSNPNPSKKKKPQSYHSIISDIFDGTLVSSVQCLTCNTVSSRRETFQDLSLPIPSVEQLNVLQHSSASQHPSHGQHPYHHYMHHVQHNQHSQQHNQATSSLHLAKTSCDAATDGWMWWLWSWLKSWFYRPSVSLHHCLAAFFSADELKGDNMYSCEKCGKLRNGIKYSKMVQLPEVLVIHLKRFRHEYMFSSKISQNVSFPMNGLDLGPYLSKDCSSETKSYDLYAVICHHGSVGGGHYTCYAQNWLNFRWYEFDDQCVTEVSQETVANCEAYVLFYSKSSPHMSSKRMRTVELMKVSSREPSLMQFYVSKQWINKFNTFSEPGPIDNSDFLCPHGGVQPQKSSYVTDLVVLFNQGVWEYLHESFGGGPACTQLYECVTCKEELETLLNRQSHEFSTFVHLNRKFHEDSDAHPPNIIHAISMRWFRIWEAFARGRQEEVPPPIDNSSICITRMGRTTIKYGSDFAPISEEMWQFFHGIYGGGPTVSIRYRNIMETMNKKADPYMDESPKHIFVKREIAEERQEPDGIAMDHEKSSSNPAQKYVYISSSPEPKNCETNDLSTKENLSNAQSQKTSPPYFGDLDELIQNQSDGSESEY